MGIIFPVRVKRLRTPEGDVIRAYYWNWFGVVFYKYGVCVMFKSVSSVRGRLIYLLMQKFYNPKQPLLPDTPKYRKREQQE